MGQISSATQVQCAYCGCKFYTILEDRDYCYAQWCVDQAEDTANQDQDNENDPD